MFLTDSHIHSSNFSHDAVDTMLDMARAAAKNGIKRVCFTDHVDCDYAWPGDVRIDTTCFDAWPAPYHEVMRLSEMLRGEIELRCGMELGELNHQPSMRKRIEKAEGVDFIIGSIHNLRDTADFYFLKYNDLTECRHYVENYLLECQQLAELGCFDVMGHIGYTNRYMFRQGFSVDYLEYEDMLKKLFKTIIEGGRGIEVNTSGLRGSPGETFPTLPVLKLYRQCGGEIVTTGSDSHNADDAGAGIKDACELLREAGFKYVASYTARKPEFFKI